MLIRVDGFDSVAGRETWFAGSAMVDGQRLGPPLGIRSLAASANGSILFANVHVGGIPRSMDGGRTWQPTIDINSDVHEVRAHPANVDLVVAAAAVGLCLSHDAGATWTIERDGLHASYCSAVGFSGMTFLSPRRSIILPPRESFTAGRPHGMAAQWLSKVVCRHGRPVLSIPVASPRTALPSQLLIEAATCTALTTVGGPGHARSPACRLRAASSSLSKSWHSVQVRLGGTAHCKSG